jgi:hypothetical protein
MSSFTISSGLDCAIIDIAFIHFIESNYRSQGSARVTTHFIWRRSRRSQLIRGRPPTRSSFTALYLRESYEASSRYGYFNHLVDGRYMSRPVEPDTILQELHLIKRLFNHIEKVKIPDSNHGQHSQSQSAPSRVRVILRAISPDIHEKANGRSHKMEFEWNFTSVY